MLNGASRRSFLQGTAAFAMAGGARVPHGRAPRAKSARPARAYVGTYSSPEGPEGSRGNGQGVYVFDMDPATGALVQRDIVPNPHNPSWIDLHPGGTHLYTANETHDFQDAHSGSVSAYAMDSSSGRLTLVNTVSSEGAGPAHLSVHPSGRYVLVANYGGGTIAVLPIRSKGELSAATDVKHDEGPAGDERASSAPPDSFAMSGHDRPHAHMIRSDPQGRYVIHTDLGLDRIFIWTLDLEKGKLAPNDPGSVALPPGDGPRHFAFHPGGKYMYSLQEEASTIALFNYEANKGALSPRATVSSLPGGFAGTSFGSEIRVSGDGRFLYAANRLHDSIAWFSIGEDGALSFAGEEWTRGDYPRSFNFDPTETFLYCCNQRADSITIFRRDTESGRLTFTGHYVPVGTPAAIVFVA